MPNYITFNGIRLIKPNEESSGLFSGRKDGARPNSFVTRWGKDPSYGWILLTQGDVDSFNLSATNHTLSFVSDSGSVTISNLVITHVESVYLVPFPKPEDLVLLKVEDIRCLGQYTYLNKSWNVVRRSWMDDTSKRFSTESTSISNGTAVLDAMWAELPAIFGASPTHDIGAGYQQVTFPEDLNFRMLPAWEVLCQMAHRLNLEVTINNSGGGVLFSPFELATADYESQRTTYADYRLRSTRTTTPSIVKFPEKVQVLFRKAFTDTIANTDAQVYSAEEDHLFNSYLAVEVTVSGFTAEPTVPGTELVMYHDRVVVDREYLLSDYQTLADNYVNSWVNSRENDEEAQYEIYTGFIPFTPQAWSRIEWMDSGNGPLTIVRLNRPRYGNDHSDYHLHFKPTFGFGQVTQVSTKYNRDTDAVSIDGRLKPVQRKTTDGLLDLSSQKEMEFASISDYPIRPCQNIFWMMDTNSSKPIAIPMGLQTNKPLFIKFQIIDPSGGQTEECPNEEAHPSNNAYVLDQEWGPTLLGDGRYQRVETSVSGCGTNQIILEKGCTGIAYLREDDVYEAMSSSCCAGSGTIPSPDSGALIYETDVRCQQGRLAVYRKYVYIILTDGVLSRRDTQGWVFSHYAGCCDCGTTVVEPPGCTGGCFWIWREQTLVWELLFEDCEGDPQECGCTYPPNFPGLFDGDVLEKDCYDEPPPPPPANCSGSCLWQWNAQTLTWTKMTDTCTEANNLCVCLEPDFGGTVDFQTETTYCNVNQSGCVGECLYVWNEAAYAWSYIANNCVEDGGGGGIQCGCFPPLFNGSFDGEPVYVNCGGGGVGI